MIGRLLRMVANEYLRNRHARTGTGPRRLPPTSIGHARNRAMNSIVRSILNRFMKR